MPSAEPMRVQVVRPRRPFLSDIVLRVALLALRGWIVMLGVPFVIDHHLSYVQAVVAVLAAQALFGARPGHLEWTVEGDKAR